VRATIFVVGFCPGGLGDDSSVGGFEWRRNPRDAFLAFTHLHANDPKLTSDYVLRRVIIPPEIDADDDAAVQDWLDSEASELWNVVAQPEPDKCEGCNEPFTRKDIDGGRCLSCGRMIT